MTDCAGGKMGSGLNIQIKMSAVLSESLRILGGYLGLLSPLSENYYSSEVAPDPD